MPDGNDKFSSWSGTNNVLVSTGQGAQASSVPKTNYADINNNSSWDENVQKNPYKYNTSNANSKIYLTNDYNQYLTVQWSQKQAAKRYNIQTPQAQPPRYNMQSGSKLMTEEEFKEKYIPTFEELFAIFDTSIGVVGDTSSVISGIGTWKTGFKSESTLGPAIIQKVHAFILSTEKIWASMRVWFSFADSFVSGNSQNFYKAAKKLEEIASKQAISDAKASGAANKLGYAALALLAVVAVYRGIMWHLADSEEEKEVWASKFRGALYNFIFALAVQVLSKSHPIAIIVSIAIAIMDACFMYMSDGECDFGYAFDLGLQWWGDTIKGWAIATGEYFTETVGPFWKGVAIDIADGTVEAAEATGEYFTETVGPFWKEVGNDIADGVGNTWDKIVDQTKRSTESGNNDFPSWEVLGPSAGL